MKNVAVVLHGLGSNGIDTLFANLAENWNYDEFNLTYFLAVDNDSPQFWMERVKKTKCKVVCIHDLDRKRLLKWPNSLKRALIEYGPFDAIHVNMDMLNGINLYVAKKVGINNRICHSHCSSYVKKGNALVQKLSNLYRLVMKKLINKYSTKKVACSDLAGKYMFDGDFATLYNGIDISKFENKKQKTDNDFLNFVIVARVTEPKNPYFVIDVFEQINKIKPNSKLYWIGNGNLFKNIKHYVESKSLSEVVNMMGARDDVPELLSKMDYFLLPSIFEGLSLSLAEAQSAGLDCFVSDTVSKLSDCGKCMFIPLDESAQDWAKKICDYIDSDDKMKINPKLIEKFDIRKMAEKLELMYEE